MPCKIFINIGLPKSASTALQSNFYPYIQRINYIGRNYKGNSKIFNELYDYIEGNRILLDQDLQILRTKFKQELSKDINLISHEGWMVPHHNNSDEKNIKVISQYDKIKRLINFFSGLNLPCRYFVITRERLEGTISLFISRQNQLVKFLGPECVSLDKLLDKYEKKDKHTYFLNLLFSVYDKEKLKKVFKEQELKFFQFEDLQFNQNKFLKDFCQFLNIEVEESFLQKIKIKENVTSKKNEIPFSYSPNKAFKMIKFLLPSFVKEKFKFIKNYYLFKKLFFKKNFISNKSRENLKMILDELK